MTSLSNLLGQITIEDIRSIMPEGLVSGAALWIRLGGPEGKNDFMAQMQSRPEKQTRKRSGWMCGAALIIAANNGKPENQQRKMTAQMQAHLDIFNEHLAQFAECIMSGSGRTTIRISKNPAQVYSVNIPTALNTPELQNWCSAPWPTMDTTSATTT